MPALSIVIPTLRPRATLGRVLDRLPARDDLETLVVLDAAAEGDAAEQRGIRVLRSSAPGASAARNAGWRAARAPLVLFLGDDILSAEDLATRHLAAHARRPGVEVGVLGRVRWAHELRVTPFMRWLERGVQFDYGGIRGEDAGWGRFYTANASLKRAALEAVGGFDEGLPFLYEDLDLAKRLHDAHGFRLIYEPRAEAEHLHPATLDSWRERAATLAVAERAFVARHPDVRPYFHDLLAPAAAISPGRGWGARLARVVPRGTPMVGKRVWWRADLWFRQQLAPAFLEAWERAGPNAP